MKLKSNDQFDYPSMNPIHLSDKEGIQKLIRRARIWEKLMQTPTFQSLGVKLEDTKISSCSEHQFHSDTYWECFIHHIPTSSCHPCCTVKMGAVSNPSAVVDPQLQVNGIKGLRVENTSIFLNVVCCCLPVIMWFLFGEVSSSSRCLGWATLFYCGTP